MNIDIFSQMEFADPLGLQQFMIAHRLIHEQEANALAAQFGTSFSTFGLSSAMAEDEWLETMVTRERIRPEEGPLRDWLLFHAQIHTATFQVIGGSGTVAPDISVADFSKPEEFYDWMFVHAQMHDYEQSQLGVT